jgi:positive regulator of sigma E activity
MSLLPSPRFPLPSRLPVPTHHSSGLRIAEHAPVMSSFTTYIIGFVILVVGLAMAAYLLDVPALWIAVGVVVALGIGVITATSRTKMKDPPGPAAGP